MSEPIFTSIPLGGGSDATQDPRPPFLPLQPLHMAGEELVTIMAKKKNHTDHHHHLPLTPSSRAAHMAGEDIGPTPIMDDAAAMSPCASHTSILATINNSNTTTTSPPLAAAAHMAGEEPVIGPTPIMGDAAAMSPRTAPNAAATLMGKAGAGEAWVRPHAAFVPKIDLASECCVRASWQLGG